MSKTAKRMLELRIIDVMRDWPAGRAMNVRAIAKAMNLPHIDVGQAIERLRFRGYVELDRLALTAWAAAANDRGEERAEVLAPDGGAVGGETVATVTVEPIPVTAGETAPAEKVPAELVAEGMGVLAVDTAVLAQFAAAAREGRSCPKNREIADVVGLKHEAQVHHAVVRLERAGLIERQAGAIRKQRRVRIVPENIWTDWTASDTKAAVARETAAPIDVDAEARAIEQRRQANEDSRSNRVAELVRREAEDLAARRKLARASGTVRSPLPAPVATDAGLPFAAQIQMHWIKDSSSNVQSVLREAWPAYWALLGRLAAACGERPIPLILRLIRDEAARKGLRGTDIQALSRSQASAGARPGDAAWWVPNSGGLDSDFDEEGVSNHG